MKHVLFILLLIGFSIHASAQNNALGVRLGLPMGVTYKRYITNNKAFELGIGSAANNADNRYYQRTFNGVDKYEDLEYRSVNVKSVIFLQGRILFQQDIQVEDLEGKFQWYWGIGGVFKAATVDFRYRDPRLNEFFNTRRNDIDLGPEGIIGLEYTFEDVPITLYGEFSMMLEFVDRLNFRAFAGTGARIRF
jgi:hypothetical protein